MISPLGALTHLRELTLGRNQISDISPLSALTNLQKLWLFYDQISDITALSDLTNLQYLNLEGNQISDIAALSDLMNLQGLHLDDNPLDRDAYCHDLEAILLSAPACNLTYSPNANPPGGVSATDGTYPDIVSIAWDALCSGPGRIDTFRYMVYRSTSLEGTKEAISAWLTGTSFDDMTASSGVHYWYWVKSDKSGEDYGDSDEGWCEDTTPPVVTGISASPSVLSPANGKMVKVTVTVDATDDSGQAPTCRIVDVTCNQSMNGKKGPDWQITGDLTVNLRAKCSGAERIYTIHVECTDASGNTTAATVDVIVRKSKKK